MTAVAALSAAAALSVPTLSTPFKIGTAGNTRPVGPARFVDPSTLRPLGGLAPVPAAAVVELSPSRREVAVAQRGRTLQVRSRRSGRILQRMRGKPGTLALVWARGERLLALQCGRRKADCRLNTFHPTKGRRIRSVRLPGVPATLDARSLQRAGSRYVVWMASDGISGILRAYIVDRDGRIRRTVRGLGGYGFDLEGRVAATTRGLVSVDPGTGNFRRLPYRAASGERNAGGLVGRTADGGVWTFTSESEDAQHTLALLDERTFEVRATAGPLPANSLVVDVLPGGGFFIQDFSGATLTAFGVNGRQRWQVPADPGELAYGVVGGYLYAQILDDDGDYRVVVRDAGTGRTLRVLDRQLRIQSLGRRAAKGLDTPLFGDDVEFDD